MRAFKIIIFFTIQNTYLILTHTIKIPTHIIKEFPLLKLKIITSFYVFIFQFYLTVVSIENLINLLTELYLPIQFNITNLNTMIYINIKIKIK